MTDATVVCSPFLRLALLALLTAACFPRNAAADDKWPVTRGPSREPMPYRHDPSLLKKIPKAFLEDHAACILYYGTTHFVEADGTCETIQHEVTRLNGRKGVERLGEYRAITYDPAYQKLTLHEARVLKANGRIVEIEPRHVQLRDVSTDFQVYDHEKQLIISFPNLEVGDTIEVKWITRGKSPEFGEYFFTRYSFGVDHPPIVREEFRVHLPKDKPFKFTTVNDVSAPLPPPPTGSGGLWGKIDMEVKDEGKNRLYHWRAYNRPPLTTDSELPSRETLRVQLAC